jgi:hypothetical protein
MIRFHQIVNPKPRELRVFAAGQLPFIILLLVIQFKWHWPNWSWGLILASSVVAVAGWNRPRLIHPLYVFWMTAVFPLGWLISHLVLAIVFYAVVTPIALLVRNIAGDPLRCKPDQSASTYWQPRKPASDPKSYFRQF